MAQTFKYDKIMFILQILRRGGTLQTINRAAEIVQIEDKGWHKQQTIGQK